MFALKCFSWNCCYHLSFWQQFLNSYWQAHTKTGSGQDELHETPCKSPEKERVRKNWLHWVFLLWGTMLNLSWPLLHKKYLMVIVLFHTFLYGNSENTFICWRMKLKMTWNCNGKLFDGTVKIYSKIFFWRGTLSM